MVIPLKNRWPALLLALCLTGCTESKITRANFDKIEIGMKQSEVEAILGKPEYSYQGVVSWSTNHSKSVISIVLDDRGCVADKNVENL